MVLGIRVNNFVKRMSLFTLILVVGVIYVNYKSFDKGDDSHNAKNKENYVLKNIRDIISNSFLDTEDWISFVKVNNRNYKIEYSFDKELEGFIKERLRRYSSDYASVVVINNDTGELLTAIDYTRSTRKFGRNVTFSSSHPAASIFKVITAADLLENSEIEPDTVLKYKGRSTTLYKYQLKNMPSKWNRWTSFQKAFAYSNNVIFGKAAINNLSPESLHEMATRFRFNEDLLEELNLGISKFQVAEGTYNLAELASGFNQITMMNPIHGAVIASIVANDGLFQRPVLIKNIEDIHTEKKAWSNNGFGEQILTEKVAHKLKEMMILTSKKGTARAFHYQLKKKLRDNLIYGGKTGTLTGGAPYGKRDWFVTFAMPQEGMSKGISICVMNINVNKWYVKSTILAKEIVDFYYGKYKKDLI